MVLAALVAAVLAGAAVQSATGFGFALVAAPVLVALLGPVPAIGALTVLPPVVNALTLAGERRRPQVLGADAARLVAWALPGLVLGALALRELPEDALRAAVGAAVLAALALRAWGPRPPGAAAATPRRPRGAAAAAPRRPRGAAAAAGAASGALSTSVGLSGPPLVLYLLARGASPAQQRDTLAAIFLALAALGLVALLALGTFVLPAETPALLAAAVCGQLAGRTIFRRLHADGHERAVLAVLVATALGALLASAL
jgi:uncharacterized membrane protein YfcA